MELSATRIDVIARNAKNTQHPLHLTLGLHEATNYSSRKVRNEAFEVAFVVHTFASGPAILVDDAFKRGAMVDVRTHVEQSAATNAPPVNAAWDMSTVNQVFVEEVRALRVFRAWYNRVSVGPGSV